MKNWILSLTLSPWILLATPDALVRLVDTISVRAPEVTLGEIANIECQDGALLQRLRSLEVISAPRVGAPAIVTAYRIKGLLESGGFENVSVLGNQSSVFTECENVNNDALKSLVENWIKDEVGGDEELSINFIRTPSEWKVPSSDSVEIRCSSRKSNLQGSVTVLLEASIGDRTYAETRIQIQLERFEEVAVMLRPVARGDLITEEDVAVRRIEAARNSDFRIRDLSEIVGMVARKNLPVGKTPNVKDVEAPVVIEKGSRCHIQVQNHEIKLALRGAVALEDGRVGEMILFTNPMNANEKLRAKVLKTGLAMIKIQ